MAANHRGSRALVLFLVALAAAGCSRERKVPAAPAPVAVAAAPKAAKLSAEDLAPVIHPLGGDDRIPDRIAIELAVPVMDVGTSFPRFAGEETVLRVTPQTAGTLAFTGPSTLTFTARGGFAPATSYRVVLERVATPVGGSVAAPRPGAWSAMFTTPAFGFSRIDLDAVDEAHAQVAVRLVFSGPVEPADVRAHAAFTVAGRPAEIVAVSLAGVPGSVRLVLRADTLPSSGSVALVLRAGVRLAGRDFAAPAATAAVGYAQGKAVTVKFARIGESPSGHYVDVACDDSAVAGRRSVWDDPTETELSLSVRCLPREDAAERIHFSPAVKVSVVPSSMGFRILGDFRRGPYSMRIDAGLRTVDGGELMGTFEESFSFPARTPSVSFATTGRYLPRGAWKSLPLTHVNVDRVRLQVREVPPADLVFWASNDDSERADSRDSDLVLDRVLPLPRTAVDVQATSWVDVSTLLPGTTRGLLEIRAVNPGGGPDAVARLVLTDLNLVAKRAGGGDPRTEALFVWALGMDGGPPIAGVDVRAVRRSGKVLAECTTAGVGGCVLTPARSDPDPEPAFALVATRGDDLTYLKFADLETPIDDAEIGGPPYRGKEPWRAAIWSDRGVVRPGERAHFVALVRGGDGLAPPGGGLPVVLRLLDPRGRSVKRVVEKTNGAGLVTFDWSIPAFADTGGYELSAATADQAIGKLRLRVEEFVPERMKVTATAETPAVLAGESPRVRVAAKYLFGATPAGARVELGCRVEPAAFQPGRNGNFTYGVWHEEGRAPRSIDLGSAAGALDDKGTAELACPGGGAIEEPARVVATASVFESGSGRTSEAVAIVAAHPERFYVGLSSGARRAAAGKPIPVSGVIVDWDGAVTPAVRSVELRLVRLCADYDWSYDEQTGREELRRHLMPTVEAKTTVSVRDGRFSATLTPAQDGEAFLVEARAGRDRTDLKIDGTEADWWEPGESQADQTPKPQKPRWITLQAPETIPAGGEATVRAKIPWRGQALFTVETDKVLSAAWRPVEAGEASFEVAIRDFTPNVYASLFVVKDPHLESARAYVPDRAFGVRSIRVTPVQFTQRLALKVPEEIQSEGQLRVEVDLGERPEGPTWATIAAVDEGILQLTHFTPPSPLDRIFDRRALGVRTFETVGWSLLLPPGPEEAAGGDEAGGQGGRVQPVKPVALWSGLLPVAADGKVVATFALPPYRGALRVMAVTAGPKRVGHADARVVVRDPLVVQATLPRFLYQNDLAQIPVFVSNLTGAAQEVTVSIEAGDLPSPGLAPPAGGGPAVQIVGRAQRRLSLAAGKDGVAVFQARAVAALGAATVKVTARAGRFSSHEQADVPLLPAGPRSRTVQQIELSEGDNDVTARLSGWVPTSERSDFWVTTNPYGDVLDHASYLLHYPYG